MRYLLLALALLACGSDDSSAQTCEPNSTQSCACPSGPPGTKTCAADGSSLSECACGSAGSSGSAGSANGGVGGGGTGGVGTGGSSATGGGGGGISGSAGVSGTGGSGGSLMCEATVDPEGVSDSCTPLNGPDDINGSADHIYCDESCGLGRYAFSCLTGKAPSLGCKIISEGINAGTACCDNFYCSYGLNCTGENAALRSTFCAYGAPPPANECVHQVDGDYFTTWCCP